MTDPRGAGPVELCPLSELLEALSGLCAKRVTLMGLGLCGGGEGAARFLLDLGADLTVTDLRGEDKLAPTLARLRGQRLRYRLGLHVADDFTGADLVVANPGVPRTSPFLRLAQEAGVPITSPMNMFLALCSARIAAVTGSNGKSTTTAMLATILRASGRSIWLGGNIGGSLLPSLRSIVRSDLVVLELSSFQLEDAAYLRWAPHVALVTNLTPNHLDRHGTFESYARAKRAIVDFQRGTDFAVLNGRDPHLQQWPDEGLRARARWFDSEPHPGRMRPGVLLMGRRLVWHDEGRHEVLCTEQDVPLPGRHNVENVMAAATAARCLGADISKLRQDLAGFRGLEHRLEFVGERSGIRFFNDSFSTTPDSTVAALASFHCPLTLIAGGYDKQLPIDTLARAAARSADVLVTMGQTGPELARTTLEAALCMSRQPVITETAGLTEALDAAVSHSMPGSAVVFSPGFASYDMFENCIQRGEVFKELVRERYLRPGRRGVRA